MKREEILQAIATKQSLSEADLSRANLSGANLSRANLSEANLPENHPMGRLDFGGWSIWITKDFTKIGCQKQINEFWLNAAPDDPEIKEMSHTASKWWRIHGDAVKACIRVVMSKASN